MARRNKLPKKTPAPRRDARVEPAHKVTHAPRYTKLGGLPRGSPQDDVVVPPPTNAVSNNELPPPPARERSSYDGDTAIKLYLREIGQVKLLTPQEEIELAARIKKGDKKAREQMIKANLRLVVKIAHDYE